MHANFWHGGWLRARRMRQAGGPKLVVIDLDGVLTDGGLHIDAAGNKLFKSFGPDDHAALKRWRDTFPIEIITSDWQQISVRRAEHMRTHITKVEADAKMRIGAIIAMANERDATADGIVYIGDGYHDWEVMQAVGFGIAPIDAWPATRRTADAVTTLTAGHRAVAEALDYIGERLVP